MKRIYFLMLAAILFCGSFQSIAQDNEITLYFSEEEMPNLIKCLPGPPDTIGTDFGNDIMRYMWGKEQRNNAERAAWVFRDAVWNYDSLFAVFSVPFGLEITKEGTPEIYKFLINSLSTVDQTRVKPKAYYHRKRPFERFNEHMLTRYEEAELSGEGSYPSGHSQRGYGAALLLSEINPDNADTIMARGYMYGESRVIAGAHWQSDVDASRLCAAIGVARLHTSAAFLKQLDKARSEYERLTGKMSYTDDCSQFVNLAEAVPDAILEIRYYSTYNFVGTRVDGYLEPVALLTKQAADSLRAVSDDLKALGYRIKIYDTYRPQMGVDHFVRWAADIPDTTMRAYFYPDLDKSVLFDQEYIMEKSGHTRGSTVDLTLFDMAAEKEVDMGGTFDWFGPESHPDFCGNPETGEYTGDNSASPTGRSITKEQFNNRMILRNAMLRHGFKTLDSEWWHFTLKNEPFPDTYFTFPVKTLH
ncbi:MAG: phosphatase PAP2 family protein [Bacteroidales bacterium]|nr:phosphatase PAP2 family protein [Bacteroidales bacterium]